LKRRLGLCSILAVVLLVGAAWAAETIKPQRPKGIYSFDIKASAEALVKKLEERFTFPTARVVMVREGEVLIKAPEEIPMGLEVTVYRPGKPIVDKETGKTYPGFDTPVALVQVVRREGKFYLAQVVQAWGKIEKGYKVDPPQMIYVRVTPPKVEEDVEVDPKELATVLDFALGESLFFRLLGPNEALPPHAYGIVLHPVVTSAGTLPVLGCYVDSLITKRSLFALQESVKLVKTASYAEIMKKRTLMETGEWEGYQAALASRVFKEKFYSVAVADVDGDGENEIILLGDKSLNIYKLRDKEFQKKYVYKLPIYGAHAHRYLRVDVADINGNGRPEIFVTSVVENIFSGSGFISPYLASMVLELHGKKFKVLQKKMPYYLMVVHPSVGDRPPVLLAQKMGEYEPFEGPVLQLVWKSGKYVKAPKPTYSFISKLDHLYGLTWDDFNLDDRLEVALLDKDNYLTVYSTRGKPLWESPDSLGVVKYDFFYQTPRFPKAPAMKNFDPEEVAKKRYIPRRLVTAYLEGDGKVSIFTVVNDIPSFVLAGIKLEAPWSGVNGRVIKLAFVGSGKAYGAYFDILWESPKFKDLYAQDLALGDVNGDGVLDVVFLSYNKKVGKMRIDIYPVPGV